jgi:hypothetical protein
MRLQNSHNQISKWLLTKSISNKGPRRASPQNLCKGALKYNVRDFLGTLQNNHSQGSYSKKLTNLAIEAHTFVVRVEKLTILNMRFKNTIFKIAIKVFSKGLTCVHCQRHA